MRNKRTLIIFALIVVGFCLYAFNLHNPLFWDDDDWIVNNPSVHSFSWQNLKFIFTHDTLAGIGLHSNYYRPFLFLTFLANYVAGGTAPLVYHLTSNLIHIFSGVLIFFLLDKFLRKRTVAVIASLLFLIHPLQTEAVSYISGRGDPLSVLLMLLALLTFLYNRRLVSYALLILAILTRETAFLFPLYLMVFLIAFVYHDRFWVSFKKSLVKALPYFGISLLYGISRLTFLNFQNTLNFFRQSNVYTEHLSYRIYTFLHVIPVYLKLVFVPTGLHMERDVAVNTSLLQWPVWAGALLIIGIVVVLFYLYKKEKTPALTPKPQYPPKESKLPTGQANPNQIPNPNAQNKNLGHWPLDISHFRVWFFAWGFFFINLAPTSGVFPINALLYEHWLYFSLFGFFTLLAFYLDKLFNFLKENWKPLFVICVLLFGAYISFYGLQTIKRNIIWGKTDKFYEEILRYEPQNVRVLNNLANYYSDNGRLKDAEDLLWRAVNANDIQPAPYYNLGNILVGREDYAGAIELYKRAIEMDPSFPYAYTNLAVVYAQQGNLTEALKYLKQLAAIQPSSTTYYNVAQVESALGHKKEAVEALQTGLKYAADDPQMQAEINGFLQKINR